MEKRAQEVDKKKKEGQDEEEREGEEDGDGGGGGTRYAQDVDKMWTRCGQVGQDMD